MNKLCLTCEPGRLIHSRSMGIAKWLTDAGRNVALPPNAPSVLNTISRSKYPDICSVNIRVKVGPPSLDGVRVLFWAANPRSLRDRASHPISRAVEAYGNYENIGVTFIKKGYISIKLACPQPYIEEGVVYPPHFHYVKEDKRSMQWQTKVYTVAAFPGSHGKTHSEYIMKCIDPVNSLCTIMTPSRVRANWNDMYVINALPVKSPSISLPRGKSGDKHIHLPYDSSDTAISTVCNIIKQHPYVVYCMDSKCHAASDLIIRMVHLGGCMNVYYMPAGIQKWK